MTSRWGAQLPVLTINMQLHADENCKPWVVVIAECTQCWTLAYNLKGKEGKEASAAKKVLAPTGARMELKSTLAVDPGATTWRTDAMVALGLVHKRSLTSRDTSL